MVLNVKVKKMKKFINIEIIDNKIVVTQGNCRPAEIIGLMEIVSSSIKKREVDHYVVFKGAGIYSSIEDFLLIDLDIKSRTYGALKAAGFVTVGEIMKSSGDELLKKHRNFGPSSLRDLTEALSKINVILD